LARKKKTQSAGAFATYPVKILDWKVDYSFHLNKQPVTREGPFWEYGGLEIQGELLGPEKVKGREIKIVLLANRDYDRTLNDPVSTKWEPIAIGGLTSRGNDSEYIGSLPFQAFGQILTILQAGKFKFLIFHGKALRYGKASIESLNFTEEFDPEDY